MLHRRLALRPVLSFEDRKLPLPRNWKRPEQLRQAQQALPLHDRLDNFRRQQGQSQDPLSISTPSRVSTLPGIPRRANASFCTAMTLRLRCLRMTWH